MQRRLGFWVGGYLLCAVHALVGQAQTGLLEAARPLVSNYPPQATSGSPQNWAVVQDKAGGIWAANTAGLLQFSGVEWALTQAPGGGGLRCLATDSVSGRVYYAGYNSFGYLVPGPRGETTFVDLSQGLPAQDRRFGYVYDLHPTPSGCRFVASHYLFDWNGTETTALHHPPGFRASFSLPGRQLVLQSVTEGLVSYSGTGLTPFRLERLAANPPAGLRVGAQYTVTARSLDFTRESLHLLQPLAGGLLVGTRSRGLEWVGRDRLYTLNLPLQAELQAGGLSNALRLHDGGWALATRSEGVLVTDSLGKVRRRIGRGQGLLTNGVQALCQDREGSLWLATDKGVARIELAQPVGFFTEAEGLSGTSLCAQVHQGTFYVGTTEGLFQLNPTGGTGAFAAIRGIESECRWLFVCQNRLFAATAFGIYRVDRTGAVLISSPSVSVRSVAAARHDATYIWLGLENDGLAALEVQPGTGRATLRQLTAEGTGDLTALVQAPDGDLWGYFPDRGLAQLPRPTQAGPAITPVWIAAPTLLSDPKGYICWVNGELYAVAKGQLYRYRHATGRLEAADLFQGIGRSLSLGQLLVQDSLGQIWLQDQATQKILYTNASEPGRAPSAFQAGSLRLPADSYHSLYLGPDGTVWALGGGALMGYRPVATSAARVPYRAVLARVTFGEDSVVAVGAFGAPPAGGQPEGQRPKLPYGYNSAFFEFGATYYTAVNELRFQYWLEGLETDWSPPTVLSAKEYTYLPAGDYTFHLRAQNVFGELGSETAFHFTIWPPWHQTWWARLGFVLLATGGVVQLVRYRSKRLKGQADRLESEVEARTRELAASKAELEASVTDLRTRESQLAHAYSELRSIQDKLIQQEKVAAMSHLVANVAHEINTPIGAIRGTANHLQYLIRELVTEYPEQLARLSTSDRELLVEFLRQAREVPLNDYTTREERELRLQLQQRLSAAQLPHAERLAVLLPKAGFWTLPDALLPLLSSPNACTVVEQALHLLMLKQGLDNIAGATEKTRKIVSTLRSLVPGQSQGTTPAPYNLRQSLLSVLEDFHHRLRQGIELKATYDRSLRVRVTPEELDQLWTQLIHNALQAMGTKGVLTVLVHPVGQFAEVCIGDTGAGIPTDIQARIFEPFFTTRQTGEGSGLGLYLVSRIVEKYGGDVTLETSPGLTTFRVRLPLAESDLQQAVN